MDILVTNDDGIDAPGIAAFEVALREYFSRSIRSDVRLIVVAPDSARSECGHSVTTTRDLRIQTVGPDHYAVDGTPVGGYSNRYRVFLVQSTTAASRNSGT